MDNLEVQVERNISLTNEKIRLEAELLELKRQYESLLTRFNRLQEARWNLQDRHLNCLETLANESFSKPMKWEEDTKR